MDENIFPISFSIPEEKIVTSIPNKINILAHYLPNGVGESSYIYNNENEYYNDYKNSLFAVTRKKSGWDCMRHYEILACGCIPYFIDLNQCPENTLINFPKQIILNTNKIYDDLNKKYKISINNNINQLSQEELNECYKYIEILLDYTRNFLTTTKIAKYIIKKTFSSLNDNILYIVNPPEGNYLTCLTFHGLKEIFGKNCDEYPFFPHMYKDCKENQHLDFNKLHGRGFTYTRLLDKEKYYESCSSEKIINNIKNKKYNLIIYANLHKEKSKNHEHIFIDLVNENYPKNKIVFLCGEDGHQPNYLTPICLACQYSNLGYKCFVREI